MDVGVLDQSRVVCQLCAEIEMKVFDFLLAIPYLIGSIIHKSDAPTQHWLFFITNNQSCVPVNPEVGRKISYIEV